MANITAAWILCAAFTVPVFCAGFAGARAAGQPEAAPAEEQALPELKYSTGDIVLPNKVATLHLGEKYHYLAPAETNQLLQMWGNPPDEETQGAILPADVNPFSEGGWAVFLTYTDDGHIDDSDANEIDYDDLLKDMKEGVEDSNAARKKAGYPRNAPAQLGRAAALRCRGQEALLGQGNFARTATCIR